MGVGGRCAVPPSWAALISVERNFRSVETFYRVNLFVMIYRLGDGEREGL